MNSRVKWKKGGSGRQRQAAAGSGRQRQALVGSGGGDGGSVGSGGGGGEFGGRELGENGYIPPRRGGIPTDPARSASTFRSTGHAYGAGQ